MKKFIILFVLLLMFSFVSSAEYQLKKALDLQVGDVIIDSEGNEIVVEKIERQGKVQEEFVYQESKSLMEVLWGKIAGKELPSPVVSGGSSELGLSLGETGVGVRVTEDVVADVPSVRVEQRKSFWQKLMFRRGDE